MFSINAIIFSNYMFCEVYRSHPWRHGYPADNQRISGGYPSSGFRVPEVGFSPERYLLKDNAVYHYMKLELKINYHGENIIGRIFFLFPGGVLEKRKGSNKGGTFYYPFKFRSLQEGFIIQYPCEILIWPILLHFFLQRTFCGISLIR